MPHRELASQREAEPSSAIRERVAKARSAQSERLKKTRVHTNAQMTNRHVKQFCRLTPDADGLLGQAMEELGLSARAYNKILKVARTIADLAGADDIGIEHVSEAIQYRSLDRSVWV